MQQDEWIVVLILSQSFLAMTNIVFGIWQSAFLLMGYGMLLLVKTLAIIAFGYDEPFRTIQASAISSFVETPTIFTATVLLYTRDPVICMAIFDSTFSLLGTIYGSMTLYKS